MQWDKYQVVVARYPMVAKWLDVPTCPEAEHYLTKEHAQAFRLEVAQHFVENRVGHIAIKDLSEKDFFDLPYDPLASSQEGDTYTEVHTLVYYHFAGQPAFSQMFRPDDHEECVTVGMVHSELLGIHCEHDAFHIDACVRHRFTIKPGERKHGIKILINTGHNRS
jgi:hypothetical protein